MPYKKRRNVKKSKRQMKRKLKGYDKSIIQYAPMGGTSTKLATKLRYLDYDYSRNYIVQTTPYEWTFRLSSLYDPNYTSAVSGVNGRNEQPSGRDALVARYSSYQVKAAKIELMVAIDVEGQTDQANMLRWEAAPYFTESDSSTPTVPKHLSEIPMGKHGLCTTFNGVQQKRTWYVDFRKLTSLYGHSYSSGLGAITGSNPGNPVWFTLKMLPEGNASHACNVFRQIRITYYVVFTGPKSSILDDAA